MLGKERQEMEYMGEKYDKGSWQSREIEMAMCR